MLQQLLLKVAISCVHEAEGFFVELRRLLWLSSVLPYDERCGFLDGRLNTGPELKPGSAESVANWPWTKLVIPRQLRSEAS